MIDHDQPGQDFRSVRVDTIEVHGYTGSESDEVRVARHEEALGRAASQKADPEGAVTAQQIQQASRELGLHLHAYEAACYHNTMVPILNTLRQARGRAEAAVARADHAWDDLNTANPWHAAHHRYAVAADDAHRELAALCRAERIAADRHTDLLNRLTFVKRQHAYESLVPAEQRLVIDIDHHGAVSRLNAYDERREQRRAIAGETLVVANQDA